MPYNISQTTAEQVIDATDAVLQANGVANIELVSQYLDVPEQNAVNALKMAEQLGLILSNDGSNYHASFPYSNYLVSNQAHRKAVILRFVLEEYPPYKTFKARLVITGLASQAATQTKALYGIFAHRDVISSTFIDLGTYASSLISEGAGLYRPSESEEEDYLEVLGEVIQDYASAEIKVRKRLGKEAADWISQKDVLNPLVTAYQRLGNVEVDARLPIVHAGNAIESFLTELADKCGANLQNATGINSKVDKLVQQNVLAKKHGFMLKYLGHVRNAVEHGIDPSIGHPWDVSPDTSIEYVHVAQSVISRIVAYQNGRYLV